MHGGHRSHGAQGWIAYEGCQSPRPQAAQKLLVTHPAAPVMVHDSESAMLVTPVTPMHKHTRLSHTTLWTQVKDAGAPSERLPVRMLAVHPTLNSRHTILSWRCSMPWRHHSHQHVRWPPKTWRTGMTHRGGCPRTESACYSGFAVCASRAETHNT